MNRQKWRADLTIYRAIDCGRSFELRLPGGVLTIKDPQEVKNLREIVNEARRIAPQQEAQYIEYMLREEGI